IETRIAILEKKAQESNIDISNDVVRYIASVADSNIRELEGILTRIAAYSSLTGREIKIDIVMDVIKNLLKNGARREITIDKIIKAVAKQFNLRVGDIRSRKKNKNLVLSRQIVMYLSRKLTNSSFPDIGEKVGGRDHSTVIYSNNKIKKMLEKDSTIKTVVEKLEVILQTGY
ncbi:MAG: chromosomal replication initiator protein DnaA, partial [Syntrophobacterales bacterium]|nr:chromosomal replication initiator protein DnaA [Syntrophobacterales bacterium]